MLDNNLYKISYPIFLEIHYMSKLITDVINSMDIEATFDNSLAWANGDSGLLVNEILDNLFKFMNRERNDSETDEDLKNRMLSYADNYLGGGTMAHYKSAIILAYPDMISYADDIKIYEPCNTYPSDTFNTQRGLDLAFLDGHPEQCGYSKAVNGGVIFAYYTLDEDVYQDVIDKKTDAPDKLWIPLRTVSANDIGVFKLEIYSNHSGTITSNNIVQAFTNDKCWVSFAGLNNDTESGWDDTTLNAFNDIENLEDLYSSPYTWNLNNISYDSGTFITFIDWFDYHITSFMINEWDGHYSTFDIDGWNFHGSTFTIAGTTTHVSSFEIKYIAHLSQFRISTTPYWYFAEEIP